MFDHHNTFKTALDAVSVTFSLASVIGWLSPLAALISMMWTLVRFYEYFKSKKVLED